jgi:cellulose synthase operon protein C
MFGPRILVLAGLLGLGVSVALACGPFFPQQLLDDRAGVLKAVPANSFAFEAAHLAAAPRDRLEAVEPPPYDDGYRDRTRAEAETAGLSLEQGEALQQVRGAASGAAAYEQGAALPAAIRLYTTGAVDFRQRELTEAAARFQAVLDLPEEERRAREVWAAFMLGRCAALAGDTARAAQAFALTRALALQGVPDPLGLAVASYGEEAALQLEAAEDLLDGGEVRAAAENAPDYRRDIAAAVALYAEQAARRSDSGVQSLRRVAERLLTNPSRLAATIADPLVQRLLVVYALARDRDASARLLEAIERQGLDAPPAADRLAALAYGTGRYELAARLAESSPLPLAQWVKAKLALQRGDLAAAASFYAAAAKAFPTGDAAPPLDDDNAKLLAGEGGVLALARGDYVDALARLYRQSPTYWSDAAYVAERVVTVDELKSFVDAEVPAPPPKPHAEGEPDDVDPAASLRDLLARRLLREARAGDAAAYFRRAETRAQAADYAGALAAARSDGSRIERARSWYRAADVAEDSGMEIMGYEAAPDYAESGGSFSYGIGREKVDGAMATPGEQERFAASAAKPDLRFHYRYVAADEIGEAADLLPPRSQAFAAVLCRATGWMMRTPGSDDRAHALYRRYVGEGAYVPWAAHFGHDCPEPDFDGAAQLWRRQILRHIRHFLGRYRWPIGAGAVIAIGLLGAGLVRRRRHAAG